MASFNDWDSLSKPRYDIQVDHYLAFLSVSKDCKWIAAAGGEKLTIVKGDDFSKTVKKKLEKAVKLCIFSPESDFLLYGGDIVYFAKTGSWEPLYSYNLKSQVSSAVFSFDGKDLFLGTYDKHIHCFKEANSSEWAEKQKYKVPSRAKDMAVDPNRKYLVTVDKDGGGLSMFDLSSLPGFGPSIQLQHSHSLHLPHIGGNSEKWRHQDDPADKDGVISIKPDIVKTEEPEVGAVCFSPDGRYLAWGGSLNALLMNVDKPTDIEPLPVDPKRRKTRTMHFSSDSRFLAYGGASHNIIVIDAQTIQPMFYVKDFDDGVWACEFAPGNEWLVSCSYSRKITVAQLFNRNPPKSASCDGKFSSRSISKRGGRVVSISEDGTRMSLHSTENFGFKDLKHDEDRPEVKKVKGTLAVISEDGSIVVWSAADVNQIYQLSANGEPRLIQEFTHDPNPHGLGISSCNQYLISDNENEVHITSVETGEILMTKENPLEVFAQAFSPGPKYYAVGYGSRLSVYDFPESPDDEDCTPVMKGHAGDNVSCISFSMDNNLIAASSEGVTVLVWEIHTGRHLHTFEHDETVDNCQFSITRSHYLLTVTTTGHIALFNVKKGQREWLKVAGFSFQAVSFIMVGGDTEEDEHIVAVYQNRAEYHSMQHILKLGPNLGDFVESVHLDNDYTEYIGRKIPFLCCARPDDLGKVDTDRGTSVSRQASRSIVRPETMTPKGSNKNASMLLSELKSLSGQGLSLGQGSRPLGKTAVQRAIELDAEECLNRLLRACPGSAVASGGAPIREALTMGNKVMLNKVLMAGCDETLSYSSQEIISRYLVAIAEKAPQVLATVLHQVGMQQYELEGYKYCHCPQKGIVKAAPTWGAGELWKKHKVEQGVEKDDEVSKVNFSRVLFPNLGSPDVLKAISDSEESKMFENNAMYNVISAMWKFYYQKQFVLLFTFHSSMFIANLLSAILSVERREDSREPVSPLEEILTIFLLAAGSYNIGYEVYQAFLDFEPDIWNILDWCYYLSLVLTSSFELAGRPIWELGAVNCVLSCLEVLFYMRGFSYTGFLIRMLVQVFIDLRMFMLVVVVIIVAFSGSFYTMYDGDTYNEYNGFAGFIVWTYLLMNQIIWETAFYEDSSSPHLNTALLCLFLFITAIVLLNFIIAILSDTFERVAENQKAEGLKERADIILELNCYLTRSKREYLEDKFRWVHVMSPWNLEWAKDQADDKEFGDGKQTEVEMLKKQIQTVQENVSQHNTQIDKINEKLEDIVQDLKSDNEKKRRAAMRHRTSRVGLFASFKPHPSQTKEG